MLIGFNINDHDVTLMGKYIECPQIGTTVCGTACMVV